MAAMVPEASKSSVRSDGSGELTMKGFSDSKKVTRTFLLGSDLHTEKHKLKRECGCETWTLSLQKEHKTEGV